MAFLDWLQRIPMWDWHDISLRGYPGWDWESGSDEPFRVDISVTHGQGVSSHELAAAFDDIATAPFYYRDWTSDTLPFVREGEVYRSAFWFARRVDMEAFKAMLAAKQDQWFASSSPDPAPGTAPRSPAPSLGGSVTATERTS